MVLGGTAGAATEPTPVVCVLGSVRVQVDGRPVPVGGPLPRRLLAILLANRDRVVSADRLVEVLWGDRAPERARRWLHSYVSRRRSVLPPSVRLETTAPGYRLRLASGAADVDRFETALDEAVGCRSVRPGAALDKLDEALGVWAGDAFAEFCGEWWARGEAERLEELRLHAREERAAVLLALGRVGAAVSDARALTIRTGPGRGRRRRDDP